jgi:hypothetical protein
MRTAYARNIEHSAVNAKGAFMLERIAEGRTDLVFDYVPVIPRIPKRVMVARWCNGAPTMATCAL